MLFMCLRLACDQKPVYVMQSFFYFCNMHGHFFKLIYFIRQKFGLMTCRHCWKTQMLETGVTWTWQMQYISIFTNELILFFRHRLIHVWKKRGNKESTDRTTWRWSEACKMSCQQDWHTYIAKKACKFAMQPMISAVDNDDVIRISL